MKQFTRRLIPRLGHQTLGIIVVSLLSVVTVIMPLAPSAAALSGSDFRAGDIVDNGVFFNTGTMLSGDVQDFLNAKVPSCDTNGTQIYSGSETRAQYGASQGYPAPYSCLKDYRQDTPSMAADKYCTTFTSGNRSAAQIIHDAAVACGINPEVILVLLQKEQSLVTDTWPSPKQYAKATGFGCPDTAPCNANYGGFFYQVYYAARAFKNYTLNANSFNYFAQSNNNILYNPSSSCGSSTVYLQNQATADLYIYTPYQPNAAALANLNGLGDGCSAYGNRNFWYTFSNWFGSTLAKPFAWQPLTQQAYLDSAHTLPVNTNDLSPGQTYFLVLSVENMGNSTWHNSGGSANNQVDLATNNPQNHSSPYGTGSWLANNRPATLDESTVSPGDTGTYEFSITTPASYGSANEYFNLVAEGQTWFNDVGLYWPINVLPPTPQWQMLTQGIYYDANRTKAANIGAMAPNSTYSMQVSVLNTGNTTWTNSGPNPVDLGTSSPQDRTSAFCDSSWLSCNRAARLQQASVSPGFVGTFDFWMQTPYRTDGTISKEYFTPVVENQSWMNDLGMYVSTTAMTPNTNWQYLSQSAYINSARTTPADLTNAQTNTTYYLQIKVKNTSGVTWKNTGTNTLNLGTSNSQNRTSAFCDSSWLSCNRAATLQESSVAPGQTGTFNFSIKTPFSTTTANEYFQPVLEGQTWLTDIGLYWHIVTH